MEYNSRIIGAKIRNARKSKGLSQEAFIGKLRNDYSFAIGRNTLIKIENGDKIDFSFDFLLYTSRICDCDIGCLLGEYEETKQDSHFICSTTGLSEKAVQNLITWNQADDRRKKWSKYVSEILTHTETENLLGQISNLCGSRYVECKAVWELNNKEYALEEIDYQMARLWMISRTFTDIAESIEMDVVQKYLDSHKEV